MIIGHKESYTFLETAFAEKRHHAFLLNGPIGVGKATVAKHLAIAELIKSGPFSANIVKQQCAVGSYPNYFYITLTQDEDGKQKSEINIDQVRSLLNSLKQKAAIQGPRIVIIDSIDQMNRQACNALLKMLEEPPQDTFFLLICHSIGRVIPTIRSRCIKLDFRSLTNEDMKRVIESRGEAIDHDSLLLASGSPGIYEKIRVAGGESVLESIKNLLNDSNMNNVRATLQDLLKKHDDNFLGYLLQQYLYNNALKDPKAYAESTHAVEKFLNYTQGTHLDGAHRLQAALLLAKTPEYLNMICQ